MGPLPHPQIRGGGAGSVVFNFPRTSAKGQKWPAVPGPRASVRVRVCVLRCVGENFSLFFPLERQNFEDPGLATRVPARALLERDSRNKGCPCPHSIVEAGN